MAGKELPQGVALVTGAAGGMGAAVACRLVETGWTDLLLCDLNADRLEAVAAPLREQGAKVGVLAADVSEPSTPGRILDTLGGRQFAAVVHAAGISPRMGTAERIFAVNLDGATRLVEAIRDRMAPGSAAVLFASNSSYFPMPPDAAAAVCQPLPPGGAASLAHLADSPDIAYPLSKLGVRALVKREAKSFGARGARLVSMSPGAIDTPMARSEPSDIADRMVATSASGRMGRPEELAAVAVFLCSPEAGFVTAVDWLVDGGHTAAMGF